MAEVEKLVLDHLRHMRGQLDRMENDIGEIKGRLGRLEAGLAQVHVARNNHFVSIDSTRAPPAAKSGLPSLKARHQSP